MYFSFFLQIIVAEMCQDLILKPEYSLPALTPTFSHIKVRGKKGSFSTYKGYDSWKSGAEMTSRWEPSNHLAFKTWVVVSQEQKAVTRSTSKASAYVGRFEALRALRPV